MQHNEPAAWMLECQTIGGDLGWILSWSRSGAGLCNRLNGKEHEKPLYLKPENCWMQAETAPNNTFVLVDNGGMVEIAMLSKSGKWISNLNCECTMVHCWMPLPKTTKQLDNEAKIGISQ